jgi:hypothetical protein
MYQFNLLNDKKQAKHLESCDYIMVDDMLWRVIRTYQSMGTPSRMLQLAYYSHETPRSFKFLAVRDEESYAVFQRTE